jgi:hypothetical protein
VEAYFVNSGGCTASITAHEPTHRRGYRPATHILPFSIVPQATCCRLTTETTGSASTPAATTGPASPGWTARLAWTWTRTATGAAWRWATAAARCPSPTTSTHPSTAWRPTTAWRAPTISGAGPTPIARRACSPTSARLRVSGAGT